MFGILNISSINDDTGADSLLDANFIAPVSIESNRPLRGSDTLNLKLTRAQGTAQRWEFEGELLKADGPVGLLTSLVTRTSVTDVFVRPPLPAKSFGHAVGMNRPASGASVEYPASGLMGIAYSDGGAVAGGAYSVGVSSIAITMSTDSTLLVGDFLRFNGHDKGYMITSVSSINTTLHTATVGIFPNLVDSVINTEVIHLGKKATMRMRYDLRQSYGITFNDGLIASSGIVRLVENI